MMVLYSNPQIPDPKFLVRTLAEENQWSAEVWGTA